MANPLKGEIKLSLNKKEYKARLTIDALMQIEDALGQVIIKVAQRMGEGDVRIRDLVTVLLPALRGGGNDLQQTEINKIVQDAGIVESTKVVATLEEHNKLCGLGSSVSEIISSNLLNKKQFFFGIDDTYKNAGSYHYLKKQYNLLNEDIFEKLKGCLNDTK